MAWPSDSRERGGVRSAQAEAEATTAEERVDASVVEVSGAVDGSVRTMRQTTVTRPRARRVSYRRRRGERDEGAVGEGRGEECGGGG